MKTPLDIILKEKQTAYALFDADLFLEDYSVNLKQFLTFQAKPTLWMLLPELVGAEDCVESILNGKKRRFTLPQLSRFSHEGKTLYYDLTLLPFREKSQSKLICLVSDVTRQTALMQEIQQKKHEIRLLQSALNQTGEEGRGAFLGVSPAIRVVHDFIERIAPAKTATVLLQGESGTGKNRVARLIHDISMPEDAPFVEINCAGIPENLLESEIFGHEKGAFTHAVTAKSGLLEEAQNGTLFLDEIGDLPLALQAKFLSFLESKRFRRLGATREQIADVRIIAATNRDLTEAVKNSAFRNDLFFRLNVLRLELPPLRNLGEDVLILSRHFLRHFSCALHKPVPQLTPAAREKLLSHSWPGNVRELRNVMERAAIFAQGDALNESDIELSAAAFPRPASFIESIDIPAEGISLPDLERHLLQKALNRSSGNVTRAAKLLDLSMETLRYRLKKFDINP